MEANGRCPFCKGQFQIENSKKNLSLAGLLRIITSQKKRFAIVRIPKEKILLKKMDLFCAK